MKKLPLLLLSTLIGLSACGQKAETSVAASSAPAASVAETQTAPALQTLTSSDNKISINIQGGHFSDVSQDPALHPENVDSNNLTLLQRDDSTEITVYAINLGKPVKSADEYFKKLKTVLAEDKTLTDSKTGIATENRMDYRFSQKDNDNNVLNENCVAIYTAASLYNVCANSYSASPEMLTNVLKDIKIN